MQYEDEIEIKKEPEISEELKKTHKEWISLAREKHQKGIIEPTNKFKNYVLGKLPNETDDKFQSKTNFYHIILKKLVPQLYPKDVKIRAQPEDGQDVIITKDVEGNPIEFDNRKASIIAENVINNILNKSQTKYTMRGVIYDALLANMGTIFIGQETMLAEKTKSIEPMENLLKEKEKNNEVIPGEEIIPSAEKEVEGGISKLIITRESYKNIMHDVDSSDYFFDDDRYCIRIIRMPWSTAKERFPEELKDEKNVGWETTSLDESQDVSDDYKEMKEHRKVLIYEIYDLSSQDKIIRYRYFGECKKFINKEELKQSSILSLKLNYVSDTTYPPSDMAYYEGQISEFNFYRTAQMNNIARSLARKILYDNETVDPDTVDKISSEKDLEAVGISCKGQPLGALLSIFEPKTVDFTLANYTETIRNDINIIAEIPEARTGQRTSKQTATRDSIADAQFLAAMSDRQELIKDFLVRISEKIFGILKDISIYDETIVVEGESGEKETITWTNKDIEHAKLVFEIDLEASQSSDIKLGKLKDFAMFMSQQGVSNLLSAKNKTVDMYELIKSMGKYYMPDKNFDKIIVDTPEVIDPDRENMLILSGQPNVVRSLPTEDFTKHLNAHVQATKHPLFVQNPNLLQALEAHIQETKNLMSQQASLTKPMQDNTEGKMLGAVAGANINV